MNGSRIVSHPVEPDVVTDDTEGMIVEDGGMSESEGGIPPGYFSSAISDDSAALGDVCGER